MIASRTSIFDVPHILWHWRLTLAARSSWGKSSLTECTDSTGLEAVLEMGEEDREEKSVTNVPFILLKIRLNKMLAMYASLLRVCWEHVTGFISGNQRHLHVLHWPQGPWSGLWLATSLYQLWLFSHNPLYSSLRALTWYHNRWLPNNTGSRHVWRNRQGLVEEVSNWRNMSRRHDFIDLQPSQWLTEDRYADGSCSRHP